MGRSTNEDFERYKRFKATFARLKSNRDKLPLEQLQTRYAKAYGAVVAEMNELADWWARYYVAAQVKYLPTHPEDKAGKEWLQSRIDKVADEAWEPGNLVDQAKAELIDNLDIDGFYTKVDAIYEKVISDAFLPYWQRHNSWVGEPGQRRIYNDIWKAFWLTDLEKYPDGIWCQWRTKKPISPDFPPDIGPDEGGGEDGGNTKQAAD